MIQPISRDESLCSVNSEDYYIEGEADRVASTWESKVFPKGAKGDYRYSSRGGAYHDVNTLKPCKAMGDYQSASEQWFNITLPKELCLPDEGDTETFNVIEGVLDENTSSDSEEDIEPNLSDGSPSPKVGHQSLVASEQLAIQNVANAVVDTAMLDDFDIMKFVFLKRYIGQIMKDFRKLQIKSIRSFDVAPAVKGRFMEAYRTLNVFPIPLYHGTKEKNYCSIHQHGLRAVGDQIGDGEVSMAHGNPLGRGVYTAKNPSMSKTYTNGETMLLCGVLDIDVDETERKQTKEELRRQQIVKHLNTEFGGEVENEANTSLPGEKQKYSGGHIQRGVPGSKEAYRRSIDEKLTGDVEYRKLIVKETPTTRHVNEQVLVKNSSHVVPFFAINFGEIPLSEIQFERIIERGSQITNEKKLNNDDPRAVFLQALMNENRMNCGTCCKNWARSVRGKLSDKELRKQRMEKEHSIMAFLKGEP